MVKSVHLGTISTTVLQNAEPLPMEKNVNLFVSVPILPVILLLDVLSMFIPTQAINHEVFFIKWDNLFIQLHFWTLYKNGL